MNGKAASNFIDTIPEPDEIRRRLDDNRVERDLLKQLLRLSVNRAKAESSLSANEEETRE